jgi:hypothetical protein
MRIILSKKGQRELWILLYVRIVVLFQIDSAAAPCRPICATSLAPKVAVTGLSFDYACVGRGYAMQSFVTTSAILAMHFLVTASVMVALITANGLSPAAAHLPWEAA